MASRLKNLSTPGSSDIPAAKGKKFGIVVSDWNEKITHQLLAGCLATLHEHGATDDDIHVLHVPGSFELPFGARTLMASRQVDVVICLGCVIKGETKHDEYISQAVANGIMNLGLTSGRPVIFGVLTANDELQALDRAGGKHGNKGVEAAHTALRMVHLRHEISTSSFKIGFHTPQG